MEDANFQQVETGDALDGVSAGLAPSVSPSMPAEELLAVADDVWAVARSAQMLGINAAIIASRTGVSAPEVCVIADDIKRMSAELTILAKRLGSRCP